MCMYVCLKEREGVRKRRDRQGLCVRNSERKRGGCTYARTMQTGWSFKFVAERGMLLCTAKFRTSLKTLLCSEQSRDIISSSIFLQNSHNYIFCIQDECSKSQLNYVIN